MLLIAVVPWASSAEDRTADNCTRRGLVPASALADSALLHGPWHTVAPCARLSGHLAHFEIETAWGPMTADGVEMLAIRVDEMPVLAQLVEVHHAAVAWDAARDRGDRSAAAVTRVIKHPIRTAAGMPSGLWRYLRGKVDSLARESRRLGDDVADELTDADEAYDDFSFRPGVTPDPGPSRTTLQKQGRRVGKRALRYIGYSDMRRTWSKHLGVDPYTSNPMLDERMDALAWSALGGDRAAKYTIGLVGGIGGEMLATSRELNDLVWDLPAARISERNAQRLAALDCGEIEVRRFLRNGKFSASLQTAIVDAIIELQPIGGCVDIMEIGAAVENEIEARYLVNALRMLSVRAGTSLPPLPFVGESVHTTAPSPPVAETFPAAADGRDAGLASRDVGARAPGDRKPLEVDVRDGRGAPRAASSPFDVDVRDGRGRSMRRMMLYGTAPALLHGDGSITLPLAVDRLQWTKGTRAFFDQRRLDVPTRTVLIAGDATPRARRALADRGWRVITHFSFPGAPPYPVDVANVETRLTTR